MDSKRSAVFRPNLSFDLPNLLYALEAVRHGDFSVRMAVERLGVAGKIADVR